MKKLLALMIICGMFFSATAFAEYVNGYTKRNGTYVNGYNRSERNGTVTDNYSYQGNINPYTGQIGSNNYNNSSSQSYQLAGRPQAGSYQFAGPMNQNNFSNRNGNSFANTSRYNSNGFLKQRNN